MAHNIDGEEALIREVRALNRDGHAMEILVRLRDQVQASHALKASLSSLVGRTTPEQALRAQTAENVWRDMEAEFGLLTATEVAERCGSTSTGRTSYAADARRSGRLLAVRRLNRLLYPGFQFGESGPLPLMRDLNAAATRQEVGEETTLQWMMARTTWWDEDSRPVDHLDDPEGIVAAFESHYGADW